MRVIGLILISAVLFTACKKGKDDPFLSLKSRNKRIKQEWVLKEMAYYDSNESNGYTMTDELLFDGTTITARHTENGSTDEESGNASATLTIEDHIYTWRLNGLDTVVVSLHWNWVDTDKKKSRIYLVDFPLTYLNAPLTIDRLTSNELVLSGDFVNHQQLFKATVHGHFVFERKK